jgi:uncharacterized protein YecE (DUF72 family)
MHMTYGVQIHVGCAGWAVPKALADRFPAEGSHLERYSARLPAVEINSSFRDYHLPRTYARWAAATPADFHFAVKMHQELTHVTRLEDPSLLGPFLEPVRELGNKLGPILIQLPPSLGFDRQVARRFFTALRRRFDGGVACEPRHADWFTGEVEAFLVEFQVARVAADPARRPEGLHPAGWPGVVYYRWHGAPKIYTSSYPDAALDEIAERVTAAPATADRWCIFNNTAEHAAAANALGVLARLRDD